MIEVRVPSLQDAEAGRIPYSIGVDQRPGMSSPTGFSSVGSFLQLRDCSGHHFCSAASSPSSASASSLSSV